MHKTILVITLIIALLTAVLIIFLNTKSGMKSSSKPRIAKVEIPKKAEVYVPIEINCTIEAQISNPFDYSKTRLIAYFTSPSGKQYKVYGFYTQDYKREKTSKGKEKLTPIGDPYWKVRFTPTEHGEWSIKLKFETQEGEDSRGPTTIAVNPSNHTGFVRLKSGKNFFYIEGKGYTFLIGHNIAWYGEGGTYDYDKYFEALSQNGGNLARIWMAPWAFAIEWDKPQHYDLEEAWKLDYVFKLAEKKGIYLILCLVNHGQFSTYANPEWDKNPYNARRGGPLQRPEEFFTNEEAKKLFKNRLTYIVARWGYSTNLLAWELFNEVDLTDNYDSTRVAKWHKEMADYIRQIDPYKHLITTSFADPHKDDEVWKLPEIDFTTVHIYNLKDFGLFLPAIVEDRLKKYGKPVIIEEFASDWRWWNEPYYLKDNIGVELHNGIWATLMSGAASTAMLWWWDTYIHPRNLYWHYKVLAEAIKDFNFSNYRKISVKVKVQDEKPASITIYPMLGWKKPAKNIFTVHYENGTVENYAEFPRFIQGQSHPDLKNNPIIKAYFPKGGSFIVKVNSVSATGARLQIFLDGTLAKELNLPDKDGKYDPEAGEYSIEVTVKIPPGTHEIKLDNNGTDWLTIDYVKLEGAVSSASKIKAMGITDGEHTIIWLKNSAFNWYTYINKKSVQAINLTITMKAAGGTYKIIKINPWTNTRKVSLASDENLTINVSVNSSIILKITRQK